MIEAEINNFKNFLTIEERSPHTIRQYLSIINWFQAFLTENNLDYSNLKEKDIVKFQMWLKEKRLVEAYSKQFKNYPTKEQLVDFNKKQTSILHGKSIYKYLTTIKKFLEVNEQQLNWTKIPTPKYDDNFNPAVLSIEDVQKIASVAEYYCTFKHHTISHFDCLKCQKYRQPKSAKSSVQRIYPEICFYFDGLKLKAMILLAYEAALRTDELCNLKLVHLDLHKKEIFIEKPLKHSQPQAVPLSDNLILILKDYLTKYKYVKNTNDILFPTKMGKIYHANNFATHVFRPIAKEAGFDVRYYTLRHSRATNLIKQGLDVGWVRRITRHRNINNVLKYIHLSSNDIREELEKKKIL
ncbi:MAG: tyrosine-type recombinase/integrase [Candidatus Heimdallarchaeota archaeon]|nr:tyrosine-type recombinase/integrase [Candidatus Heimdallarchaeota archaeon]